MEPSDAIFQKSNPPKLIERWPMFDSAACTRHRIPCSQHSSSKSNFLIKSGSIKSKSLVGIPYLYMILKFLLIKEFLKSFNFSFLNLLCRLKGFHELVIRWRRRQGLDYLPESKGRSQ